MKKFLIFLLVNFSFVKLYSQNFNLEPEMMSPNVASLDTYGNIPLNLFTGKPDISIPIYTVTSGSISVPIVLSYHSDNVKPAVQPGWTGFGWSLNPGGVITRKMRFGFDERYNPALPNQHISRSYYPYPEGLSAPLNNVTSGSEIINSSNSWSSSEELINHFTFKGSNPYIYDAMADEFSFNFLGYSGKFFYSGPQKGWQVVADQNIKVELVSGEEFLNHSDIWDVVDEYAPTNRISRQNDQIHFFGKFRITTPDGTKYEFGGKEGVELSSDYAKLRPYFYVNTWRLTKITDVKGNTVHFKYKRSYPTCTLGFTANANGVATKGSGGFLSGENSAGWGSSTIDVNRLSGKFIYPLYLQEISGVTSEVKFNSVPMSRSQSLYYTDEQIATPDNTVNSTEYNFHSLDNNPENIKWEKLDEISIRDKASKGTQGERREVHKFLYSSGSNRRLTLTEYFKANHQYQDIKRFSFEYNNIEAYDGVTCDGNFSDHWGYLNKINAHGGSIAEINNRKNVKSAYLLKGLIDKITYPTGGYTKFEWEPHDYSQVVSVNRKSLLSKSGFAGGVRIKEIQNYLETGDLAEKKKFLYKKNYSNGSSLTSLSSSGILNVIPQYSFYFSNRPNNSGDGTTSISFSSFNSLTGYGYTGKGSHVGYDEVVQENIDGSYTKHYFTSYGRDINGFSHFDRDPEGYVGFEPSVDTYMPYSLLEVERGKKVGVFHYRSDNKLMQKTRIGYRTDNSRFNEFIRTIPYGLSVGTASSGISLVAAIREFTFNYYPVEKEVTTYDLNGQNPVVSLTKYNYNSYDQLSQVTQYDSDNSTLVTQYFYPHNYTSDPIFQEMKGKHILSPIVREKKLKNNNQIAALKTSYYSPFPNIFVPLNVKKQQKSQSSEKVVQEFHSYDIKGNIRELSKEDGVKEIFIWGYNSIYPVAKIKIKHKTYNEVIAGAALNMEKVNDPSTSDSEMRIELQKLRTKFPDAQISTFTFDFTYGTITSATDIRSRTSYYIYDKLNKLKYVKDNEGNVVNKYDYNYKTN